MTDARGNVATTVYDDAGQVTQRIDPLGGRVTLTYDDGGRLVTSLDGRGLVTTLSYDQDNRRTGVQYQTGGRATFTYDAVGRLATMEDASGVTTYGYTDAGELAAVVYPGGKRVTYTYDAGSRRTAMVDPDGGASTYSYDAGSRLTSLLNPFGETTSFVYDALGRATTMTLGNTATVTLAFDAASRITGVRNAKSDGTEIAAYAYTRDNVGNPTAVALTGGDLLTFSYDANYRLTREQRSGANAYDVTYTFDQVGNRTAKIASGSTTTYTFNAMDQLTTEEAPAGAVTTYSFDAAGNNTVVNADGSLTTYAWDLANRMTGAALPTGGTVTLVYDATGLRRSREDASGLVRFVWDGQNVLQETDSGGTTQAQYTCGTVAPGGAYGPVLSQRRGATSAFYHPNDLGTINRLTDASQNVTDLYVLDAWGRSVSSSGSTTNPHRYVGALGYYTEPDLGLDYVRARWLRPATGSWVSVDPVLTEPRYGYVGGRAVTRRDAAGLQHGSSFYPPGCAPGSPCERDDLYNCYEYCDREARTKGQDFHRRCMIWCVNEHIPDPTERLVEIAKWQLRWGDIVEDDPDIDNRGTRLDELEDRFGQEGVSWCTMFVADCLERAGIIDCETMVPMTCVNTIVDWGRTNHEVITKDDPGWGDFRPQPGDIAIFGGLTRDFGDDDHAAIVTNYSRLGDRVVTIDGNMPIRGGREGVGWRNRHAHKYRAKYADYNAYLDAYIRLNLPENGND